MKKLLSFMGLFIMIFVLASCSLFKKDEPVTMDSGENIQTEVGNKEEPKLELKKEFTFDDVYQIIVERSFDEIVLSYAKDLFSNKLFETKSNVQVAVKHPLGEGSIELDLSGKYGRGENNSPKADLAMILKGEIDSEAMEAKGSGYAELFLKVIGTKTFINLQKLDIKSNDPKFAAIKEQTGMFMDQWILSDTSDAQIPEMTKLQEFDFAGFMGLVSKLMKANPIIKEVGQTIEGEYVVYDIELDGENIYKVMEGIAKSEYAEDTDMTLENLEAEKEQILKDIEELEYESKLRVKDNSDIALELKVSEDETVTTIVVGMKAKVTTLDIEVTDDNMIGVFALSKDGSKIDFEGSVEDKENKEGGKASGSLEIIKKGKTKTIDFDLNIEMMGAIVDIIVNSKNTEIDSLEIVEPSDAKTMGELMGSSMPEDYNSEMEMPEGYENGMYPNMGE